MVIHFIRLTVTLHSVGSKVPHRDTVPHNTEIKVNVELGICSVSVSLGNHSTLSMNALIRNHLWEGSMSIGKDR